MKFRRMATITTAALMLAACGAAGSPATTSATSSPSPTASSPSTIYVTGYIGAPISIRSATQLSAGKDSPAIGAEPCATKDGYDDIHEGAQVTVTDENGKVVGLGNLTSAGLWADAPDTLVIMSQCRFNFTVAVPSGATFYRIEVAHRGVVRYTASEVATEVHLTLGK